MKALVLRADVAAALGDSLSAKDVLHESGQISLTAAEREAVAGELERASEIT